ncbi:MAG: hypothetical protein PHN39_02230, partial [Candidatus Pacebacteria bacterium]|nr:hypothetical protein [Candidatus Paceibacterota bacterium]
LVHIRTDMPPEELDWLIKNYNTQVINLHPPTTHPHLFDYSTYKKMIFLENAGTLDEKEIKKWAGVCLDFSHLENYRRLHQEKFARLKKLLAEYLIGCNHISAVTGQIHTDENGSQIYAAHQFEKLTEFDYLKNYPMSYFSPFIGLELENTLKEQLKVKDYILKILNG